MMTAIDRPITKFGVLCLRVFCATFFLTAPGLAQGPISPVTSSGLNTHISGPITVDGMTQYDITGGTRAGPNLFHSFGNFNVPNNNIANFLNDTGLTTNNILGRVTGGNISNIFGTIQTTGFGNANLFLMNPAGIVFGPTASLNVGGSVTFTTADYLRLADNGRFNAAPNATADALLSTAPVAAYGFLGSNPGAITVQGSQFKVPEGQGISLVGGNITIQNETLENGNTQPAHLSAQKGHINLATAKSPGEFLLQGLTVGGIQESESIDASMTGPNVNGASFTSYGSIHLAQGSAVDVSQTGNSKVSVRGGRLILEIQNAVLDTTDSATLNPASRGNDTIVLSEGSSIISQTSSVDRGPDVQMTADHILLVGSPQATGIPVNIWARTDGKGDAGNIALRTTADLRLANLVDLESSTEFPPNGTNPLLKPISGNAGNIELTSTHGNILMIGSDQVGATVTSFTSSTGHTGQITMSATEGNIILDNFSLFTAVSPIGGLAGPILITSKNLELLNGTAINDVNTGPSKPEGIDITLSGKLTIAGRSIISTASLSPTGAPAADINITAKDIVVTQESIINSGSFRSGPGGNLKIVTDTLRVTDGAQLSSGSTKAPNRGRLLESLKGISPSGAGGDITIQAQGPKGSVLIDGAKSGIFADTEGTGVGGSINLSAKTLTIQNDGTISASTTGTSTRATGGSIIIIASDQVTLTNGASITASSIVDPKTPNSGIANAGNIKINAGQQLELGDLSSIKTTTESAKANGGNIDIRAIDRIRLVNSSISTSVKGDEGSGGNITIDPNVVVLQNSNVSAQAVRGAGGNITITTPLFLADSTSLISASSQKGIAQFGLRSIGVGVEPCDISEHREVFLRRGPDGAQRAIRPI